MGEPSTTYAGAALAATEAFSLTNASASVANATEAFLSDTVTFLTHPPDAGSVANATETFLNDAVHFLTETDAYSWSVDRLKDSQSAYTWSKDVVLQVQSRGQQRLQSLGLLPGWLTAAAASGESVEAVGGAHSSKEDVWAALLLLAWVLELVGPASLAVTVAAAVAGAVGAVPLAAVAGPAQVVGGAWACGEAAFFLLCAAVANVTSRSPAPASFASNPRRRELWRRILADPSQSPVDFVEGWMYREAASDQASLSPAELLLRWAAGRLGLDVPRRGGAQAVAAATAQAGGAETAEAAQLVEPLGVPYSELAVGDVYEWLAGSLYSRASRRDLAPHEEEELRELVGELEQACGTPLKRLGGEADARASASATTPGVRSMSASVERIRWRHRPLLCAPPPAHPFTSSPSLPSPRAPPPAPRPLVAAGFTRSRRESAAGWSRRT